MLEGASELVANFVRGELGDAGGFKGRDGEVDLYYTVFGLECLAALQLDSPTAAVGAYLKRFGDGDGLDLVHLASLARCWADVGGDALAADSRRAMLGRLEAFRSGDGGYHVETGRPAGTVYGCFLALGAYQDLEGELPHPAGVVEFLESMRTPDGAYSNDPDIAVGSTTATAAAVALLRHLGATPPSGLGAWLEARFHEQGGFVAMPRAPMPDLLSTATTLHALAGLEHDFSHLKEPCLDFVDTLWTNKGAFHGNWADDVLDCEYTYYGLLALGHLSL